MDADTVAAPGCAAAVLRAALRERLDVVSFAPRFDGQRAMERWLQPALLVTLLFRNGAVGDPRVKRTRVMANGQCFLADRRVLLAHGGYAPVRGSFAEDVSLARWLAGRGVRVGFLDGSRLFAVRGYSGAAQMWREWGRSLDLKDATHPLQQVLDILFVVLAQGAVWPFAMWLWWSWPSLPAGNSRGVIAVATAVLLGLRWMLLFPLRGSYARRGLSWWLSPLVDPLAAIRLLVSSVRRPTRWRARVYGSGRA
jgi:dolichol-phosphate mannosyltransferase